MTTANKYLIEIGIYGHPNFVTGMAQPSFVTPTGSPTLPGWVDAFSPVFGTGGGPNLSSWTRSVGPSRMIMAMGETFNSQTKLQLFSSTLTSFAKNNAGSDGTLRTLGNTTKAVIDSAQSSGVYLLAVYDGANFGKAVLVNAPELFWGYSSSLSAGTNIDGSFKAIAGDVVVLNGRNLVKQIRSTSSVAVGTGSKTFTVPSGHQFTDGKFVHVHVNGSNGAQGMEGLITSHTSTSITFNSTRIMGSGTYADWNISGADYCIVWEKPTFSSGFYISASAITYCSPYEIWFTSSGSLTNQDYSYYVHNSGGGGYGWSNPLTMTVTDAATYDPGSNGAGSFNFAAHTITLPDGVKVPTGIVNDPTKDFSTALNEAATYALGQGWKAFTLVLQAGNYYMKSGRSNLPNIYIQGQGKTSTFIQTTAAFNDSVLLDGAPSKSNIKFSDLKIDTTTGGTFGGGGLTGCVIGGGIFTRFDNVAIDSRNWGVYQISVAESSTFHPAGLILNSVDLTGMGVLSSGASPAQYTNVNVTIAQLGQAQLAGPFAGANTPHVAIINCTAQDLNSANTDGTQTGTGRFYSTFTSEFKSFGFVSRGNTTTGLVGPNGNTNEGEQHCWEPGWFGGTPPVATAATGNNITHNTIEVPFSLSGTGSASVSEWVGKLIYIVSGKGAGQWGYITGISGNIFTIHKDWDDIPDSTSVCKVNGGPSQVIIYNNNLQSSNDGRLTSNVMHQNFGCTGACWIVDGNSADAMHRGQNINSDMIDYLADRNKLTNMVDGALWFSGTTLNVLVRDQSLARGSGSGSDASLIITSNSDCFVGFDGGTYTDGNIAVDTYAFAIVPSTAGEVDCFNVTFDAGNRASGSHTIRQSPGVTVVVPGVSGQPAALGSTNFVNYASNP